MELTFIKLILELLKLEGVECFLGGSRRFGYSTLSSDVDIIIYVNNRKREDLITILNAIPKPSIPIFHQYPSSSTVFTIIHADHTNIDLIIFSSLHAFYQLKAEHERVEKFLQSHPEIVKIFTYIKMDTPTIQGSTLYRSLLGEMVE